MPVLYINIFTDEMEVEPEVSEGAEASSSTEDPPAPLEDSASAQGVPPVPPLVIGVFGGSHSHNWGAGHKLSDQDQLEEDGEPAAPAPPAFQEGKLDSPTFTVSHSR